MLAVRDNERAAAAAGVNVAATKLQAFALSAFIASLAGTVLAYQTGKIAFERFAPLTSVFFVSIAYIGGIVSVGGALAAGTLVTGGITFTVLNEFGALDEWQGLISGVLLIFVVLTQPDGIAVATGRQLARLRRRLGLVPAARRRRAPDPATVPAGDGAATAPALAERT